MTDTSLAIERVINAPQRKYTKQEAQDMLRRYGVLTKNNTVSKAYREIIVRNDAKK